MPSPITLEQIFGAFVRQGTLEEAALEMADLARSDPETLTEIANSLRLAINSNANEASSVVAAVERSGYRVSGVTEAKQYCSELLQLFQGHIGNVP